MTYLKGRNFCGGNFRGFRSYPVCPIFLVLAEDAIKAALKDYQTKQNQKKASV